VRSDFRSNTVTRHERDYFFLEKAMPITEQQLLQILPNAGRQAGVFVSVLNTAMNRYGIVGTPRAAAFIAQVGHESDQLTRLVESLNYSADGLMKTWPSRFDSVRATAAARNPEQIANIVYAGRMGNAAPGDGWKYRGRGLIQVTGKTNYAACGEALGLDLISQPELLEQPQYAAMSAAWFWSANGLNTLADAGDLTKITRRINGGTNGMADRQALYDKALKVLA
jgi:putative chitinase